VGVVGVFRTSVVVGVGAATYRFSLGSVQPRGPLLVAGWRVPPPELRFPPALPSYCTVAVTCQ